MAEPGLVYSGGVESFATQATLAVSGGPQIRLWVGKAYDGDTTKRTYSQTNGAKAKVRPIRPVCLELRLGMEGTAGGSLP